MYIEKKLKIFKCIYFCKKLIFISSSSRIYMFIKFLLLNERLEGYKNGSLFAYRAALNSLDTLAATLLKEKNYVNNSS